MAVEGVLMADKGDCFDANGRLFLDLAASGCDVRLVPGRHVRDGTGGARRDTIRDDLIEVWAYASETVYVSECKGARARRVWVVG